MGIPLAALNARVPEQPDLLSKVGQVMQLRNISQQGQLQQAQLTGVNQQNKERASALQEADAVKKAIADVGGDIRKALPTIMQVSPPTGIAYQKAIQEWDNLTIDGKIKKLDLHEKQIQGLGQLAATVKDQPSRDAALQQAVQQGLLSTEEAQTVASQPFDPTHPTQWQEQALTAQQQIEAARQKLLDDRSKKELDAKLPGLTAESTLKTAAATDQTAWLAQNKGKTLADYQAMVARKKAQGEAIGKTEGEMGGMGGGAAMAPVPSSQLAPGARNDAALQGVAPNVAAIVKAIDDGRMALPSGFALRSAYWQNILGLISKYDPSFDAVNYNARAKTRADFTSGASSKQINALNTAIQHLDSLSKDADALSNSKFPAWNSVKNLLSTQAGDPRIKRFNTTRNAVSDELTRVWRQAGGTEADIQSWQKNLDAAGSPAQLHGVIAQIGELLKGKIDAFGAQYGQGMGTEPINTLTPQAQKTLDIISGKAGGESSGGTVKMKAPNGQVSDVAADQVEHYKSLGATVIQ